MIRFQAIGSRISACADAATGIPAAFFKRSTRAGTVGCRNGRIPRFRIALSVSPSAKRNVFLLRLGSARRQRRVHLKWVATARPSARLARMECGRLRIFQQSKIVFPILLTLKFFQLRRPIGGNYDDSKEIRIGALGLGKF
jgi:hypothetical protein